MKKISWPYVFSAIGLPSGSLLTFGGRVQMSYFDDDYSDKIWQLKDDEWSLIGSLSNVTLIRNFLTHFLVYISSFNIFN